MSTNLLKTKSKLNKNQQQNGKRRQKIAERRKQRRKLINTYYSVALLIPDI